MHNLKITIVSLHACMRTVKQSLALMQHGHYVRFVCSKTIPQCWESFKTVHTCLNKGQLYHSIKAVEPDTDIFYASSEPYWLTSFIKEITNKPVVMDVHDSYIARTTDEEAQKADEIGEPLARVVTMERNNLQVADALVFPSGSFGVLLQQEYKLEQPFLVMPSYVPKMMYSYNGAEYVGGLTYEGLIMRQDRMTTPSLKTFGYADYLQLASDCKDNEVDFYVYLGKKDPKVMEQYISLGSRVFKPQVFNSLLKAVSRHDWGLVGNVHKTNDWKVALPNKFFEYMAAGIPIVAINADECSEWLDKYGVGITVSSISELKERRGESLTCKRNVVKYRDQFCMDNNIWNLEELFKKLL